MTEVAVLGIWYKHTDLPFEDHVKLLAQVPYKSREFILDRSKQVITII